MAHPRANWEIPVEATPRRGPRSTFILAYLACGHMVVHWYQQLWPVIIPSIKASLGLSDVQVGALSSLRQFSSGPLWFPSGFLADTFRKQTALILGSALAVLGLSYLLVGLAPSFALLLPAVALLGVGTALWHPASLATLSRRFPERKGSAVAVHGVGASVGDTVAPLGIGALLLVLDWRNLLDFHLLPALLLSLLVWKGMGSVYRDEVGERPSLVSYWVDMKRLFRHRVFLAILIVNTCVGMARLSTLTFLPLYLQEHLGYSTFVLGVHVALLYAMGTLSQPVLGYLSDRLGRKAVLLPSLVLFGLLYLALAVAAPGLQLALVVLGLGLFFYALATVMTAAVMDLATERSQASTMGVSSLLGQVLTIPAPIIAGVVVTATGMKGAFVYSGVATLTAALLLAAIRMPRSSGVAATSDR